MTNINQAREYAQWMIDNTPRHHQSKARAAAEVIQSLPDQWVDAEKVREIYDRYRANELNLHEAFRAAIALTTPPLPTLADMDEDARHALIGKDVKVEGWNNPSMLIAVHKDEGAVLGHNWINPWPFVEVRPLSELTPVDTAPDQQVNSSESPKSSLPLPKRGPITISPPTREEEDEVRGQFEEPTLADLISAEDVPAGEVWEVETPFTGGIGYRSPDQSTAWFVTYPNHTERTWNVWADSEITLVSRLVPEVAGE